MWSHAFFVELLSGVELEMSISMKFMKIKLAHDKFSKRTVYFVDQITFL